MYSQSVSTGDPNYIITLFEEVDLLILNWCVTILKLIINLYLQTAESVRKTKLLIFFTESPFPSRKKVQRVQCLNIFYQSFQNTYGRPLNVTIIINESQNVTVYRLCTDHFQYSVKDATFSIWINHFICTERWLEEFVGRKYVIFND